MRIGVNCFLLQKDIGGLKQYFLQLFNELLKSDDRNSYVFFYFKHNIQELKKLKTDKWKENSILLNDQNEIMQHLEKIDVYFCIFGALWPRPVPKPSVLGLVDIQEKFFPQFFTKQDLWNREMHFMPSTRCADQVVTISEFSKKTMVKFHRIHSHKVHVAYLAADEFFYDSATNINKSSISLPENYIFYPANRWLHKNHDNLLKALVILKREHNLLIDCVLTGYDGPNGYPLKGNVEAYGLTNQIHDIGYVSRDELKYIYKNASMLCFPSLFEGFGMPLVEAMACGCPVACSNVTSIPEVVGDAALLFNPEDPEDIAQSILKLLTEKIIKNKLRKKGIERAKLFSQRVTAAKHVEAFKKAAVSFRKKRYYYYKCFYEPIHRIKMLYKKIIISQHIKMRM
jgi:glycosyltransferase involved in cell wall biosynthesis